MKAYSQTFDNSSDLASFLNNHKIPKEDIVACVYVPNNEFRTSMNRWTLIYYAK